MFLYNMENSEGFLQIRIYQIETIPLILQKYLNSNYKFPRKHTSRHLPI